MHRRSFFKSTAAVTAVSYGRILAANERIRIGAIGVGGRCSYLLEQLNRLGGNGLVAVCDVYEPHCQEAREKYGPQAREFPDYRRLLETWTVSSPGELPMRRCRPASPRPEQAIWLTWHCAEGRQSDTRKCKSSREESAMKRTALLLVFLCSVLAVQAEAKVLMPRPQKIQIREGKLPLNSLAICFASDPAIEDSFTAEQLSIALSRNLGRRVPVVEAKVGLGKVILLSRTGLVDPLPLPDQQTGPESHEAYSLKISPDGGEVRSRSSAGLFYAVQTLRQLIEGEGDTAALPSVEVEDWPSLAYRGIMVDMSHGPLFSEEEVKRQLDFLSSWKGNQFYFYSEASVELEKYPLLNPKGRFSQEQVRRIIAYGRERHVDVIPCLELYGHLHDLFRVERYSELAALPHGGEFNPRNPKVIRLLEDWADELVRLFPSPFVHIGFDETWQIEMAAQKEGSGATPAKLFVQQLNAVAGLFQKQGKRVMAWGDIIKKYPEIYSQLPPGLIDVAWEYDPKANYGEWLDPLTTRKIPHMIATAVSNWREIVPDYEYTFDNIDRFLVAAQKSKAVGHLNTLWTDSSQNLTRQAWPAIAYGAIADWQSEPIGRERFFQDYAELTHPPASASEIGKGLEAFSSAELRLQKALGQETIHVFWDDPLQTERLNKSMEHREDLRQTRLLAEDALEHFYRAQRLKADPDSLFSFVVGSQMLDYAGLKFLTGVELAERWKELGPIVKQDQWWNRFNAEWTYQSHGHPIDLMDQITELRRDYRQAWLMEYTEYRLDSTLGRWDAEYQYWRGLQAVFRAFSEKLRDGQMLPPLDSVVHGQMDR